MRKQLPLLPGLAACAAAVSLSLLLHSIFPFIPAMTSAVALGILAGNLPFIHRPIEGPMKPGLTFAGKRLMRAGIVVLGLKLSVIDIMQLGWVTFGIIALVVLLTFVGTYFLGKLFRLPGDTPLLIATGFSICGASAIGAMAAARGTKHEDTVLPVALVTLCGTLAIGVLPLLMLPLNLDAVTFGQWVGISVHDVGQVVAAAQVAGGGALAVALVFKLTRVVLLAPIVSLAALVSRRRFQIPDAESPGEKQKMPPVIPLFVVGFLAMILIRSLGWVSPDMLQAAGLVQDIFLGSALFGLGASVKLGQLLTSGLRGASMALCAWFLIAALGYGAVRFLGAM
ncbi:hypothetical protein ASG86_13075 [Arthrobacter sp. Soil764]|nr:hypothetical protein ASG86_13075 [Arthrobacter sp. Soil764]